MRIGVTGNYASGKGTVCSIFEELGGIVIDTDIIAREIVEKGSPALVKIAESFGKEMIDDNGELDRKRLASAVFTSKESVEKLNAIMHPLILELTLARSGGDGMFFINAPLLFEAHFDRHMDYIILVYSQRGVAAERGMRRDSISHEQVELRTEHQFSFNEIREKADFIIDNNVDLIRTRKQVERLWKTIQILKHRD